MLIDAASLDDVMMLSFHFSFAAYFFFHAACRATSSSAARARGVRVRDDMRVRQRVQVL